MLITELSSTRKKALAQELRKLIEPDNAQSKRTLKETEIRKYLSKKGLTYYGISDIISVLKKHYNTKTVERLSSKILKPIVWDTCLCALSSRKLTDMLYNNNVGNIITTAVYDELLKLSLLTDDKKKSGMENALNLAERILDDSESQFCTLVDLPKDTCVNNYVDNQLLWYCKTNNYELYTRDYVLGLRAKQLNINVTIFTCFDKSTVEQYVPNPNGKNIILSLDLLDTVTFKEMLNIAKEMGANKFILSSKFIENLDKPQNKIFNRSFLIFLVNDSENLYTGFMSEDEDETKNIAEIAEKYNAVVFSSDIRQCLEYKMSYIPYKLVKSSDEGIFKTCISSAFALSPYYTSDLDYEDNLDDVDKNEDEFERKNSEVAEKAKSDNSPVVEEVTVGAETSAEVSSANIELTPEPSMLVPYYKPKSHQIPVKKLPLNEKIWVLDENGQELTPDFKDGFTALSGYTVIHIVNHLNKSYKLNVYRILNNKTINYCTRLISLFFDKNCDL